MTAPFAIARDAPQQILGSETIGRPPEFSDEALALRFADEHEQDLRYVAQWSKWLVWDGRRWQFDSTKCGFDFARKICRKASAECNKLPTATGLASAKTVAAVERLAQSDRRLAATSDQWDADPMLLNTPDGVVDLRSGHVRPHRAEDFMIHMTAVGPGGDCPLWQAFLNRITDGDVELQLFLQRVTGYALTGSINAHAMFFAYGTGANGKGVLFSAIGGALGDYHRTAPIETFTASSFSQHPTDLASLRGARLVTANETEEGRRWAEARIKVLTGGDKIAARFMRQDFFEYVPQFKLMVAGNHKPGLRSVDEAMRRRLHLIPFTVTIPPKERDPELGERLKAEWPGILAWMIEGCLQWQREGLAPPAAVTQATNEYLEAEDTVSAWIDETCELDANAWSASTDLYHSWKAWADRSGEFAGNLKRFRQMVEDRGFVAHRKKSGRGYFGLRLVEPLAHHEPHNWAGQ